MKILVTGASGFIGSHLIKELDGEVYGMVRWTAAKREHEGYIPVFCDLRDYHNVAKVIKDIRPSCVVHLGAITPVSLSFERPHEYFDINVMGTINLAEANLRYNEYLEKFVFAGTPEEYGIQEELPIKEDAPLKPNSPYAVSKAAASLYLQYMHKAYDFPTVISRHANCYGRKEQTHFVIESIVTQMLSSEKVCLGDPMPVRDFLYIDDVCKAYKMLIQKGEKGEVYNFGMGRGYSIKEAAELAEKVTGFCGAVYWHTLPARTGEILELVLDSTKAGKELGWHPNTDLESGLRKVADHWRDKLR